MTLTKSSIMLCTSVFVLILASGCEGPAGKVGMTGPQGEQGAQGDNGENGTNGTNGTNGINGMDGTNGMDAVCANIPALDISGITGISDTFNDNSTTIATVETNATDPSSVRLSFAGSGIPAQFIDNGDSTFSITIPFLENQISDAHAIYSIIATDGCTVATYQFMINHVQEATASLTVVNLTDLDVDVWSNTVIDGQEDPATKKLTGTYGVDSNEVSNITMLRSGIVSFDIYDYSYNASLEDYDMEDLLSTSPSFELDTNKRYTALIITDDMGDLQVFINEIPEQGLVFTHLAPTTVEVDIWNADNSTPIIQDLAYGSTLTAFMVETDSLKLGFDFDNDMNIDSTFFRFLTGSGAHVLALEDEDDQLYLMSITYLDDEINSSISNTIPPLPDINLTIEDNSSLPYHINYNNDEDGTVDSPSFRTLQVPNAQSITLTLKTDMEDKSTGCWDTLTIYDGEWNIIYQGCEDSGASFEVIVPGDIVMLAVESDGSGEGYYEILGINGLVPSIPMANEFIDENTNYPITIDYQSNEGGTPDSPSFRTFVAPGANSLDIQLTLDMDSYQGNCDDTLSIYDSSWNLVYMDCPVGDESLTINIPGNLAIFSVTSDRYGNGYYQIDGITINE